MAGFRKQKPMQAAIKMAIYGSAGKGKTFTTLLLTEGISKAAGKRVAYVDTESGTDFYRMEVPDREVHPGEFDIDVMQTRSIAEVSKEVRALDPEVYCCVVIDSMTHLWEAAREAYRGKKGPDGQIPMHAWGKIKKPYKDLENFLMNSPFHIFLLGRQGVEYAETDAGELKAVGTKMKAEGETPYEPHILLQLDNVKCKGQRAIVTAFAEKDRTGVLAGRTIEWPNFENIALPILKLLGSDQTRLPSADETRVADVEAMDSDDVEKARKSESIRNEYHALFTLAKTGEEIQSVSKKLTKAVKSQMVSEHLTELREAFRAAMSRIERQGTPDEDVHDDLGFGKPEERGK